MPRRGRATACLLALHVAALTCCWANGAAAGCDACSQDAASPAIELSAEIFGPRRSALQLGEEAEQLDEWAGAEDAADDDAAAAQADSADAGGAARRGAGAAAQWQQQRHGATRWHAAGAGGGDDDDGGFGDEELMDEDEEDGEHPSGSHSPPPPPAPLLSSFEATDAPYSPTLGEWQRRRARAAAPPHELTSSSFLPPARPAPGYAAACLVVRDAHDDIREWARHHLRLGFRPLYVYDDSSTPPMAEALAELTAAGDVVYEAVPERRAGAAAAAPPPSPQLWAYDRCLRDHGAAHTWLAFFDVDEFLVFRGGGGPLASVPALLREYEAYSALKVHWLLFGSSGHEERPRGGVLRSYTRCLPRMHTQHLFVKSIVNTRCTVSASDSPHHFIHNCSAPAVRTDLSPVEGATAEGGAPLHDPLALHHYATKSVEEFKIKMLRGSGMRRQREWVYFDLVDSWSVDFNFDGLRAWDDDVSPRTHVFDAALAGQLERYAGEEHDAFWARAAAGAQGAADAARGADGGGDYGDGGEKEEEDGAGATQAATVR